MAENHFTSTIESLFKGMDQFVTTKTVVGEPVQVVWLQALLQKVQSRKTKAVAE